jgi:hypothetical protein
MDDILKKKLFIEKKIKDKILTHNIQKNNCTQGNKKMWFMSH